MGVYTSIEGSNPSFSVEGEDLRVRWLHRARARLAARPTALDDESGGPLETQVLWAVTNSRIGVSRMPLCAQAVDAST